MSWSLGETRTLAVKAARGAGMTWGLAEEAGFAVHWLQSYGAPGVQALAGYLRWRDAPGCETAPVALALHQGEPAGSFCPLALGAALADAGEHPGHIQVCQPLLLAPFLAVSAVSGAHRLRWRNVELLVSRRSFTISGPPILLLIERAECRLLRTDESLPASPRLLRVAQTEQPYITVLERFAAKTYAPSTDQSRLTGAGAGLSDNE